MRRGTMLATVLAVCLIAPAAFAGFGISVPKAPKAGDVKKVEEFVKSADVAYTQVRGLSVQVPTQVTDLADQIMGIKDLPLGAGAMEKYAALKGELMGAVTTVKTTNIADLKSLQSANAKVDEASTGFVTFLKEVTSTEEMQKALGGADISAIKTKAQAYLDEDTGMSKTATEKAGEAGTKAPEAAKEYALGVAEDHIVVLDDKTKMTMKQAEELVTKGGDHADKWRSIAAKRVDTLSQTMGILGLK